jgi:hypothetical protein
MRLAESALVELMRPLSPLESKAWLTVREIAKPRHARSFPPRNPTRPPRKESSFMRLVRHKLVLATVFLAALAASACHAAHAADPPRTLTPTIDIEVEDRAADKSSHVVRFSLGIVDGHAQLKTRDGEAKYHLSAQSSSSNAPHFSLNVRRSDTSAAGDLDLSSAIPLVAGPRVVVAKIDRADGRLTSVVAQVR